MLKKIWKPLIITLLLSLAAGAGGFVWWANDAAAPGPAALSALETDGQVVVIEKEDYILFYPAVCEPANPLAAATPADKDPHKIGFIFYPGGRVDYRAYAPVLKQIAARGYPVYLVPVALNLAFFDIDAAAPVIRDNPEIRAWVVGGHSLGGVAASVFAARTPEVVGIVYWAAYPTDDALKQADLPALSISGTRDGLATPEDIAQYKTLMPADARFVVIEGGNHAQFGDYGPQAGDNPATISPETQWQQIADATAAFLASLAK
ncbi:MAG: alpha/beta family hydrolase [Anaerolineales bacterium]